MEQGENSNNWWLKGLLGLLVLVVLGAAWRTINYALGLAVTGLKFAIVLIVVAGVVYAIKRVHEKVS